MPVASVRFSLNWHVELKGKAELGSAGQRRDVYKM